MASLFFIGERQITDAARHAWTSAGRIVHSFHPQGLDEAMSRCDEGDLFLLEARTSNIYATLARLSEEHCPVSVVVQGAGAMARNYQWCPMPLLFVGSDLSEKDVARCSLNWTRRSTLKKFVGLADLLSMAASLNLSQTIRFSQKNREVASIVLVNGRVASASAQQHDKPFALRWIDEQERLTFTLTDESHAPTDESLDWESILATHVNVEDLVIQMLGEGEGTLGALVSVASLDQPVAEGEFASESTGKYEIIWKQKNVSAEWVSRDRGIDSVKKPLRIAFSTDEFRTVG